jgi:hypothetical protein
MRRGRFPYCCSADAVSADIVEGLYGSVKELMACVKEPMSTRGYDAGPMAEGAGDGGAVLIIVSAQTYMDTGKLATKNLRGKELVDYLVKYEDAKHLATWKTIHGNYNMYLVGWFKERKGADAHE